MWNGERGAGRGPGWGRGADEVADGGMRKGV